MLFVLCLSFADEACCDIAATLNFGGSASELHCDGGEAAFVETMIDESADWSARPPPPPPILSFAGTLSSGYAKQLGSNHPAPDFAQPLGHAIGKLGHPSRPSLDASGVAASLGPSVS